jgi:hypothetical protein
VAQAFKTAKRLALAQARVHQHARGGSFNQREVAGAA